ncbi:MAG: hypothetical protein ACI9LV_000551 [Candidatus Nanohaloarchaea archaeon]|jgi:hypothetical protein
MEIDLDYSDYTVNQEELGKVLLIASAALLVTSVHAALQFGDSHNKIQDLNQDLDRTQAVMNGEDFNESMEALESVQGTQIGPRFSSAVEAFNSAENSIQTAEEVESDLDTASVIYQWLVLISIMGVIAGLSLLYI